MRILMIAAALVLAVAPAAAQGMGKRHHNADQKTAKKFDDKAYFDAVAKIPNAKQPYDPWKIER